MDLLVGHLPEVNRKSSIAMSPCQSDPLIPSNVTYKINVRKWSTQARFNLGRPKQLSSAVVSTSSLILSDLIVKMNETLLQAAVIADKNGGNCGKDKLWKWRACFFSLLFLQVLSRRVEQVEGYPRFSYHLTTEDDFWIWFAFYYCSFPKEHHSSAVTELVQFLPDVGFFKSHLFPGGRVTPYNGLYGEAPPERGSFSKLQVYKRVVIPQAEL